MLQRQSTISKQSFKQLTTDEQDMSTALHTVEKSEQPPRIITFNLKSHSSV